MAKTSKMPDYKLMYFDARGQAEVSRLLFAAAGVKYKDERYDKDTFPAVKSSTPCGQLPVLVVDGQMFSQSIPIAVYLAEAFGLHGSSPLETLKIDEVVATCADLKRSFGKAIFEKDETKKAELKKKLKEDEVPKNINVFEKFLSKSTNGFFGKKLTIADVIMFDTLDKPTKEHSNLLDGSPKVKANMEKVRSNPGIKEWLTNRPQTEL